jgi:hypothetical protein
MSSNALELGCRLVCPECGHASIETMPVDACVYFHLCPGCGKTLRPKAGDCCVFCSYGSIPCPPVQLQRCCGAPAKLPPDSDSP